MAEVITAIVKFWGGKSGNIRRRPRKILIQAAIAAALPPTVSAYSMAIAKTEIAKSFGNDTIEVDVARLRLIDALL